MPVTELSKKNKYYIPQERQLELTHFCRQYYIWKLKYKEIEELHARPLDIYLSNFPYRSVEELQEKKDTYYKRFNLIDTALKKTSDRPEIQEMILGGITTGKSYDFMSDFETMPVSRNEYYNLYHKFFWILDKIRDD